jgi:prolyl-tRNA synthetase
VRRIVGKGDDAKTPVALDDVLASVQSELAGQQELLLAQSLDRREGRTADVTTVADAREAAATGFARIPWDSVGAEGELELAGGGVTVRCLQRADGTLPEDDGEPDLTAYVARSY